MPAANTLLTVLASIALFALLVGLAFCFLVLRRRGRRGSSSDAPLLDDGQGRGGGHERFGLMTLSEYERQRAHPRQQEEEEVQPRTLPPVPEEPARLGTWARFHAFLG